MHLLVTGASGFIGRSVVKKAGERGWIVTRVARHLADTDITADLREPMHGWPVPDAVIHLAGSYAGCGTKEFTKSDIAIARNLIEWGLKNDVRRWVFASAAEVYGDVTGTATESSLCQPVIPYGRAKLEIEGMFRVAGLAGVTICRLGEVYGPGGRILQELGSRLSSGFCPWPGNGEVPISFLHVDDAAEALVLACEQTVWGVQTFNVGDDVPATWRQLLDEMASLLSTRRAFSLPKPIARGYALALSWADQVRRKPVSVTPHVVRLLTTPKVLLCTRARENLGFVPRYPDFKMGLKETLRGPNP